MDFTENKKLEKNLKKTFFSFLFNKSDYFIRFFIRPLD